LNYLPIMRLQPGPALVLAIVVLSGCGGSGGTATPAKHSGSVGPPVPPYVADRTALGSKPCGIQVAGDRVWVSNYGDGTVQWFDRHTGAASPPVEVGNQPCGVAVGGGSVWVEDFGSNEVTRVDQRTGRVRATIGVGGAPYDVAFAAGAAWVTDYADGTVSRVDARTGHRTVIDVGGQPTGIAPAAGGLWVGLGGSGDIVRIDAGSSRVTDRLKAAGGATWTAYSDDTVWVSDPTSGAVTRVDAVRRRVVATVPVGATPLDGVVVDGAVYVPDADGRIFRIDPATNTVTATLDSTVANPFVITGDDGQLWAVDFKGTEAVRIDLHQVPG
jgi:YVTN family beta-propeller protein